MEADVAEVKIWGKLVGAVVWNPDRGYATFEYDPKFKQLDWDLAPLKMPVADYKINKKHPRVPCKPFHSPQLPIFVNLKSLNRRRGQ